MAPTLDMIVLEALVGTTAPRTLSQIQRLSGAGSLSGHLKALNRLVEGGVVLAVPGGYVLNRDHVAAPAVEAMAGMRSALLTRIREHVTAWRPEPALVGLFGSAARRDGDASSDVDILVVRAPGDAPDAEQAADLAQAVRRWSGNETHVVDLTDEDLRRMERLGEMVVQSWSRELVPLVGEFRLPSRAAQEGDANRAAREGRR